MSEPRQRAPVQPPPNRYVRVALRVALHHSFEYRLPVGASANVGDIVAVSLRGKAVRGVVAEIDVAPITPLSKIREIGGVEAESLAADQIALCKFVAQYYRAPIGMAYALAMPPEPVAERTATKAALQILAAPSAREIVLNAEQRAAARAIVDALGSDAVFCLRGITGSGKTEVYVAAMREVIARGGQALVLVPEINLTPQWVARLQAQLPGAKCVAIHSGLSDGERYRAWRDAAVGDADIVFGTRMCVFTPVPRLALIVVDEEHDASFKQQETPRYHARDLAVLRGRTRGVPVVLGSATPSLETYANVQRQRYRPLALTQRAVEGARAPRVGLVPARDTKKTAGLALYLLHALDERMSRGEQSLIFLNRRGFSPLLHCHVCNWQAPCTECDAHMVFHAFDNRLRCHHCGTTASVPDECPSCGNVELNPLGLGTQKIEAYLRRRYPQARIARADADSTRGKHDWAKIYDRMAQGEIDILVGTQMIAKGHDFPKLTLVGVVGADDALYSADFRAGERLFAQLSQVAGRAGRAQLPGEVLIQTDMPDHPVFRAVIADDFDAFASRELAERESAELPPASSLALVRVESAQPTSADNALRRFERALKNATGITCYPPVPSPLARRANRHRWQMLVTAQERSHLHAALARLQLPEPSAALHVSIDVDAIDFT